MRKILSTEYVAVPKGVTVRIKARDIVVKGPRGTLHKNLKHLSVDLTPCDQARQIRVDVWSGLRKHIATIKTAVSVLRNMFTGVTKGVRYEMRAVYAHFPLNLTTLEDDTVLEIRNFLGEKRVRRVKMLGGGAVKVRRSQSTKDCLLVEGNDVNEVSQSAALIRESCLVKKKDIRKFLDGIYVSEKQTVEGEDEE